MSKVKEAGERCIERNVCNLFALDVLEKLHFYFGTMLNYTKYEVSIMMLFRLDDQIKDIKTL